MSFSLTLLSAALTRISSTILKKPGTYLISRCTIRLFSESQVHIICVIVSTLPMYESGRLRICSSWES